MKDLLHKPGFLNKVEFWTATSIFVIAAFFLSADAPGPTKRLFEEARTPFYYYSDYFFPQLIKYTLVYLAFLLLNFKVVPHLIRKEEKLRSVLAVVAVFLVIWLVFGVLDTYAKNYLFSRFPTEDDTYDYIFQETAFLAFRLLLLLGFYSFIKYTALYLLANSETIESRYRIITRDALAAFVLWMVSMFLLLVADADGELLIGWGVLAPFGIMLYCFAFYYLIPLAMSRRKPLKAYLWRVALVLVVSILPVGVIGLLISHDEEYGFGLAVFNASFQFLITAPLAWVLYKRQMQGQAEVFTLKKELGQSTASFDFLRSQINPHFLFNALNTIYGTAIQENAERTSEGIEKLGNMMRFMLQENMQERISLAREIEYLQNYISFQRLRTDPSPNVEIKAQIEQPVGMVQISPMLLIPFVENAFKHGISLREPSHIYITLEMKEKTLYFDVHNSKHLKQGTDPERDKSGIGLANVRQRLQLLYPHKHELIIRETGKEFFIHLTLQLS
ncbi:sensor histidine kinase [Rufibacter psychrotolerans]|uniref:sensor histidine kinase n=1 Tax=Rufibacter psychrotolerans TaxID=2812556 RepID=UPI0019675B68|nr:histidine kinase [Rufibacter sp. SYSU D00308]